MAPCKRWCGEGGTGASLGSSFGDGGSIEKETDLADTRSRPPDDADGGAGEGALIVNIFHLAPFPGGL